MALVEVNDLVKHFPVRGGILNRVVAKVNAVNGVSFKIEKGEVFGIVGESGCVNSTLGKTLIRLIESTDGTVGSKQGLLNHIVDFDLRSELRPQSITHQTRKARTVRIRDRIEGRAIAALRAANQGTLGWWVVHDRGHLNR